MNTNSKNRVLLSAEIKARLGITHSQQFARVLPGLVEYGAFKMNGLVWRMYEKDFERYLTSRRMKSNAIAAAKLERRAQ